MNFNIRKHPFILFALVIAFGVLGAIWFIQSQPFARIIKKVAKNYIPNDIGIEADFKDFSIKLFPPGISINSPKITVREKNILKLPPDFLVQANQVDLNFRLFQVFSGIIRVDEVVIYDGEVNLSLSEAKKNQSQSKSKALPQKLRWEELFSIRIDTVTLLKTKVNLALSNQKQNFVINAPKLSISKQTKRQEDGYQISAEIAPLDADLLRPFLNSSRIQKVIAEAEISPSGINLSDFTVTISGAELKGSGILKGNILNAKDLKFDSNINLKANSLELFQELTPKLQTKFEDFKNLAKTVEFNGKASVALDHFVDSLKMEGDIRANQVDFKGWEVDELTAQGTWNKGELIVDKGKIVIQNRDRVPPYQTAKGGVVEFGPVHTKFPLQEVLAVPLRLDHANIQSLVGGSAKGIFSLLFNVSGDIQTEINLSKNFQIRADLNLAVDHFQLDNQHYGRPKPLRRTLKFTNTQVKGGVVVDQRGIEPKRLLVNLPKTNLEVNGRIDFKKGFDLKAEGFVNLEDIGEIAEIPIKGSGNLKANIHGPLDKMIMDFYPQLKDAMYLNLHLGSLDGMIRWDDDPSHLTFNQVKLVQGVSTLLVNGLVDASPKNSIDLNVTVSKGDIKDVIYIFNTLAKDISWLPRTLNGQTSGTIQVKGGLDLNQLLVVGNMIGNDWEYWGERFKKVKFTGGYDKGVYFVKDFSSLKRTGSLAGKIAYDSSRDRLDWDFNSSAFTFGDFNFLSRLDVPVRGNIQLNSNGSGKIGTIQSQTLMHADAISVRGNPFAPTHVQLKTDHGIAKLQGSISGGQATADVSYDFNLGSVSSIRLKAERFDFSPLLLLINPSLMNDRSLSGQISAGVNLDFRSGQVEYGSGRVEISDYRLAKSGTAFSLVKPVSVFITDGSFKVDDLSVMSRSGKLRFNLVSRRSQLEGRIFGESDSSIAEFLTSSISSAKGSVGLDVSLRGKIKEPKVYGRANFDKVSVLAEGFDSPIESLSGSIILKDNIVTVQRMEGDLAGGRVFSQGKIQLFTDRYPEVDLRINLNGPKLKVYPFQFAKVRGALSVAGAELPYMISGNINVESALSRERFLGGRKTSGLKTLLYAPPPTSSREGNYPTFTLKVDVLADHGIMVQNDLFDAEFKGKVTVINTFETPRIIGTADLIQGRLLFKDRQFFIQSAGAKFDNPTIINPLVNLAATTDVSGTKIQLYASGRLDQLKIDLSSNPVLPESEILSLLALGMTASQTARLNTQDRQLVEQGEAASLLLHSLDFNREVKDKTGLQIQLDQSLNTLSGTSLFRPQNPTDAAAPKIVVKRQIGKKLDVSFGNTVGVGSNYQRQVNAEYKLTPGFSVIGVWDNFQPIDAPENITSYGVDLKVQKRFK